MFCKNCGKEIDDSSITCKFCGIQIEKDNTIHSDTSNTQKNNKLNIINCIYSCAMILIIIIIFTVDKNYRSTQNNNKLEIQELTNTTTIELNTEKVIELSTDTESTTDITNIESKTDIKSIDDLLEATEKKLYFDMDIHTFIENYNKYFNALNKYDLTIDKDILKNNNDDKITAHFNNSIILNITYDSYNDYKIKAIEFTSENKSSSTTLEILNCVVYTTISTISSEEANNFTEKFVYDILNNNNNDIGTLINDYIYTVSYSSNDNIKIYISTKHFYEETKLNDGSSCHFDISTKDFINNYNEYLNKENLSKDLQISSKKIYKDENFNINKIHIYFVDYKNCLISAIVYYNPYFEKGIESIRLHVFSHGSLGTKEEQNNIIKQSIEPIAKALVYSINKGKNNNKDKENEFVKDLVINSTASQKSTLIEKYFDNYKYSIYKDGYNTDSYFQSNIDMYITKEYKNDETQKNFGIKVYDFIDYYNYRVMSYIDSDHWRDNGQPALFMMRICMNNDNIKLDTKDIIEYQLVDDYTTDYNDKGVHVSANIQIKYNPNSNEIKSIYLNFKNIKYTGEYDRIVNSILYALYKNDSNDIDIYSSINDIDIYSSIIQNFINYKSKKYLDVALGKYRYVGNYFPQDNLFRLSISMDKNKTIQTIESPFDISVNEFSNNYNNYIEKTDYKDLIINNDYLYNHDSLNLTSTNITDNINYIFEYDNDSRKINKIKYKFIYYNENLENVLQVSLISIMQSINKDISIETINKDTDDLIKQISTSKSMNISKIYQNYNYQIIYTGDIIFITISKDTN